MHGDQLHVSPRLGWPTRRLGQRLGFNLSQSLCSAANSSLASPIDDAALRLTEAACASAILALVTRPEFNSTCKWRDVDDNNEFDSDAWLGWEKGVEPNNNVGNGSQSCVALQTDPVSEACVALAPCSHRLPNGLCRHVVAYDVPCDFTPWTTYQNCVACVKPVVVPTTTTATPSTTTMTTQALPPSSVPPNWAIAVIAVLALLVAVLATILAVVLLRRKRPTAVTAVPASETQSERAIYIKLPSTTSYGSASTVSDYAIGQLETQSL